MESELVTGDDLRDGDVIMEGIAVREFTDHKGNWGLCKVEVLGGVKGHSSWGRSWRHEKRFSGPRIFRVRSPRPPPPVNEFGPVCP